MSLQTFATKSSIRTGWLFALSATLIYGFQPILLKLTLSEGVRADDLLVVRLCMATLIFWVMTFLRRQTLEPLPRDAFVWTFICAACFVLGMFGYTLSLSYLSASVASMIFAAFPLVTLLLMALLGEHFTRRKALRVALGLLGVYLVIGPGGELSSLGTGLALGACVIYAIYLVIMQKRLSGYSGKTIMLYVTSFTAMLFMLLNLSGGVDFSSITLLAWTYIILQAAIATYAALLLVFSAIKRLGSAQIALLFPLELLLTILWSVVLLNESLSAMQLIGGTLILASLVLAINNPKFLRRRLIRPRI